MTDCVRGCTIARKHLNDCSDEDECGGCLPRPSDKGLVCERCYTALTRDVSLAPSLVRWLREHVEPGAANQDGKTTGTRNPPAPLSTDAVAAADDLHAQLASWVLLILEEHPDRLHGPDWRGSVVRPMSKRTVTQAHDSLGYPIHLRYTEEWREPWVMHVYDEARAVGVRQDGTSTENVCRWLLARLGDDWTTWQPWIGEMVREVIEVTATLLARWPQEARSRAITDLPCPKCDRLSLVYYPVTAFRGKVLVQCEHYECGKTIDEDMWSYYARVIVDARKTA
jgi:hypothetical protein